mmetsp:Transcript_62834/g.148807  ORF Transcript_62834/g.148807 Transcript_62834/m.148807 type:complete len:284 (+) Transcript_62834:224-1075(+)
MLGLANMQDMSLVRASIGVAGAPSNQCAHMGGGTSRSFAVSGNRPVIPAESSSQPTQRFMIPKPPVSPRHGNVAPRTFVLEADVRKGRKLGPGDSKYMQVFASELQLLRENLLYARKYGQHPDASKLESEDFSGTARTSERTILPPIQGAQLPEFPKPKVLKAKRNPSPEAAKSKTRTSIETTTTVDQVRVHNDSGLEDDLEFMGKRRFSRTDEDRGVSPHPSSRRSSVCSVSMRPGETRANNAGFSEALIKQLSDRFSTEQRQDMHDRRISEWVHQTTDLRP